MSVEFRNARQQCRSGSLAEIQPFYHASTTVMRVKYQDSTLIYIYRILYIYRRNILFCINLFMPFGGNNLNIQLVTDMAARAQIQAYSGLQAYGINAYRQFKEDWLEKERPAVRFHDPITKCKLKTCFYLNRKAKQKIKQWEGYHSVS